MIRQLLTRKQSKTKLILRTILVATFSLLPSVSMAQNRLVVPGVLDNLRQNGVLTIGIRKDAPPFGYLEGQKWTGVCLEIADLLKTDLEKQLNRPIALEIKESSIDEYSEKGRLRNIKSKNFFLECGPNTIVNNPEYGISYSTPFFYTGTYFLVNPQQKNQLNTQGFLSKKNIGVLQESLTQTLMNGLYQLANVRPYQGARARELGVKDAIGGRTDAFASDGVLLLGETLRLGINSTQYSIIPDQPLSCVSYGFLLPANDPTWNAMINDFINRNRSQEVVEKLFGKNSPFVQMGLVDRGKCQ